MEISIEIFRGASPEKIDEIVIKLFQEYEEITIIELDSTYGCYIESIEAMKEDIASFLARKRKPDLNTFQHGSSNNISINCFKHVPAEGIEEMLKTRWNNQGEIKIIELNATYNNTPESINSLKKDVALYFSVIEEPYARGNTSRIEGTIAIRVLYYVCFVSIFVSMIGTLIGGIIAGIGAVVGGIICVLQSILYTIFLDHILCIGERISEQGKRIEKLESQDKL